MTAYVSRLINLKEKLPLTLTFSLKFYSLSHDMSPIQRLMVSHDSSTLDISLAASTPKKVFTISLQNLANNKAKPNEKFLPPH
jgi:hypothetical protein